MIFTCYTYPVFLVLTVAAYWLLRRRQWQNLLLLAGSYVFYGWVHPWFCILIAASTVIDYLCGLGMARWPGAKRRFLCLSLASNLGLLGAFKYFDFFARSFEAAVASLGWQVDALTLNVLLPVGISFYTFQTLSYTLDIYRGRLHARRDFFDFALFVAFFPQLVAGPIERARRLLPQIETPRRRSLDWLHRAWPLLVSGYMKKLVVADNIGPLVDNVFLLQQPSALLLSAGALGFAIQIYADFSAYTDIARGSARLLGFELMENFNAPYLAISPSDFWRRWHISFSTWIRDYLYIPLGGSRVNSTGRFLLVLVVTLGLSGLWHGAAWHFLAWGLYHALLVFLYHRLGLGGRWQPAGWWQRVPAWAVMFLLTLFGWMIFRAPDMGWLLQALTSAFAAVDAGVWIATGGTVALIAFYTMPLLVLYCVDRVPGRGGDLARGVFLGLALALIVLLEPGAQRAFIYFRF